MSKLTLTTIPTEFLTGKLMGDAKKDLRQFTKKSNITNADAFRYLENAYSKTTKLNDNRKTFSFEELNK